MGSQAGLRSGAMFVLKLIGSVINLSNTDTSCANKHLFITYYTVVRGHDSPRAQHQSICVV